MKIWTLLTPILVAAAPAAAQVMAPPEYVANAGASDLYERTSSQLVLETTSDPRVRSFAEMMIAHHTQSTADVAAAAADAGLAAPPPRLNPLQTELVAQLQAEQGAARDLAYIAQQKAAHGQALNIHKAYAMDGTEAPLRTAAAQIVPVVQSHIEMLKTM